MKNNSLKKSLMKGSVLFLILLINSNLLFSAAFNADSVAMLVKAQQGNDKALLEVYRRTCSYLLDNQFETDVLPYLVAYDELAHKNKDNTHQAYVNYMFGKYYFEQSNLKESIVKLNTANELILNNNDSLALALKIKLHLAYSACYLDCGMLPEACEHLQNGLKINQTSNVDPRNEVVIKHNLAILYTYLGQYEEAIKMNFENLGNLHINEEMLFSTYYNLSINYLDLAKPDSALYCIDKAAEFVANDKNRMMCLASKGDICLFNKAYSEAEMYYKQALVMMDEEKEIYSSYYYNTLTNLAKLSYYQGLYDDAFRYADCIDSSSMLNNQITCLKLKIDMMRQQGLYEPALELMMQKERLQDSLLAQKDVDRTNSLLMQYELKELENEYNTKQEIMKLRSSRERIALFALIGLLLSVAIVALLLLNRKKILLKNKQLNEEAMSKELETRNREIASNVITSMQKNEIYAEMVKKLQTVKENAVKDETKTAITGIIKDIEKTIDSNINEEFVLRFKQVHSEFYNALLERYPNLTPNEIRLCAYLKLNMTTKEICTLTGQTERSIVIARYRLRRKLGLETGDASNLATFIASIGQ